MQSAYHALPSPDDPSLNATQTAPRPFDIDAALEESTQSPPDLKNPGALYLLEQGLQSKAIDREYCSKFGLLEECDGSKSPRGDKHRQIAYITCHQRYCKYCAPAIIRKNITRWYESHPYLRKRHNFVQAFLLKDFNHLPTGDDLDDFNAAILAGSDLAGKGSIPGTGALWNTNIRRTSTGYRLEAKFLWWGDFDRNTYGFEGIHAEMSIIPAQSFDACLKDTMQYDIPADPVEAAKFETVVHGHRTLHSAGGFVRAKNVTPEKLPDISEELFPTVPEVGNNSPSPTPKAPCTCNTCGAAIVRRSGKVSVDLSPDEIAAVPMYDIQPPG